MDEESQLIDEWLKKLEEWMDTTFTFNIRYMKFIINIFVLFDYTSKFLLILFNSKMFLLKFTYF
jgi:hypothetical protein